MFKDENLDPESLALLVLSQLSADLQTVNQKRGSFALHIARDWVLKWLLLKFWV